MKIVAIGDIHGVTYWKEVIKHESFDHLIFIGDYFDNKYFFYGEQELNNFKEILALKQQQPNKVSLLIGNHDFHYSSLTNQEYSGFQGKFYNQFTLEVNNAIEQKILEVVKQIDGFTFSHAGLTKSWLKENNINIENLETTINDLLYTSPVSFEYNESQSTQINPLWVRKKDLLIDCSPNLKQIFGHTITEHIEIENNLISIDSFTFSKEYLVIENGVPRIDRVNTIKTKYTP